MASKNEKKYDELISGYDEEVPKIYSPIRYKSEEDKEKELLSFLNVPQNNDSNYSTPAASASSSPDKKKVYKESPITPSWSVKGKSLQEYRQKLEERSKGLSPIFPSSPIQYQRSLNPTKYYLYETKKETKDQNKKESKLTTHIGTILSHLSESEKEKNKLFRND